MRAPTVGKVIAGACLVQPPARSVETCSKEASEVMQVHAGPCLTCSRFSSTLTGCRRFKVLQLTCGPITDSWSDLLRLLRCCCYICQVVPTVSAAACSLSCNCQVCSNFLQLPPTFPSLGLLLWALLIAHCSLSLTLRQNSSAHERQTDRLRTLTTFKLHSIHFWIWDWTLDHT